MRQVSALIYDRVGSCFKFGDVNSSLRKAQLPIITIVKMLAIGIDFPPVNSQVLNSKCDAHIEILNGDDQSLHLIQTAQNTFTSSGLALVKRH